MSSWVKAWGAVASAAIVTVASAQALPGLGRPATPKEIVAQAISQIRTLEDLEEVNELIGDEVLKAIGRA